MNSTFTRRTFAARFASVLSALGVTAAVLPNRALAQGAAAQDAGGIRKLNSEGKPGSEKDVIMPVVVHHGLIYVAGQGAHDTSRFQGMDDRISHHHGHGQDQEARGNWRRNHGHHSSVECLPGED